LPFAGGRDYSSSNVSNQGDYGFYWSSTRFNESSVYGLYFDSSDVYPQGSDYRARGFSVRCLKDDVVEFDVTFYPNNGEEATTVKVEDG
jgi:uncharacterized protein (TIGR02145 family)